jgi:hypothetical protein
MVPVMIGLATINIGCTALNTFPKTAHPGETITLAVGSGENLTQANINSVTFTSTNSCCTAPLDITTDVRSVFRLYADKASNVYETPGPGTNQIIRTSLHEPWLSVIAIDLPEEYSAGVSLPEGPATITINTTNDVTYPTIGNHINDVSIGIVIAPETSPTYVEADPLTYQFGTSSIQPGNLSLLEPRPHALIKSEYSEDPFTLLSYAAIEMKVDFTGKTSTPVTNDNLTVVVDDMVAYTNSNRNVITSVHNEVLTVILFSMNEQLKPYEMRFSAVLEGSNTFTGTPTIISTDFYDLNGVNIPDSTIFTAELR